MFLQGTTSRSSSIIKQTSVTFLLLTSASPQPGDGRSFITVCFSNLPSLLIPPLQKKSGVVKAQEKKERWKEKKVAKRQKKDEQEATAEEEENVQPAVDPLENGFLHHAEREQERMNERLLKKTYSKKNKMVSVSASPLSNPVFSQLFSRSSDSPWTFFF